MPLPLNPIYDEKQILQKIAEGSEDAFRTIFHQYAGKLKSYILKISSSKETAEDIVHDVFLNIWKNRQKLSDIDQFDSYLFTAARHATHRSFQRRAKETLIVAELQKNHTINTQSEGENRITSQEVQSAINKAIQKLTPQQRKILLLSREEGLSHYEIAERLNITRRTVSNTISEALQSLRNDIHISYGPYAVAIFVLHGIA